MLPPFKELAGDGGDEVHHSLQCEMTSSVPRAEKRKGVAGTQREGSLPVPMRRGGGCGAGKAVQRRHRELGLGG